MKHGGPPAGNRRISTFRPPFLCPCSLALQFFPAHLSEHIENELGDDVQLLAERYHNSAKQFSDFSGLGVSDFMHVQQPLLTTV